MSGTLFVVATPIGNLEDVTLRALRVLREADLIAAEDTRRTARLLSHHGIGTPTISFHQHNWKSRVPQLLARLQAGTTLALVTDAGTPGISDPGAELVSACIPLGIPIDPVPGVSAPLATAVASGFPLIPLTIFGFPPRRSKARSDWFTALADVKHTLTFFESPLRIRPTLKEAAAYLGMRQIVVGREVTKRYQEFVRGSISDVVERIHNPKGEITVVVSPEVAEIVSNDKTGRGGDETQVASLFASLAGTGRLSRRAAITETAKQLGLSPRTVYAAVEKAKMSGD